MPKKTKNKQIKKRRPHRFGEINGIPHPMPFQQSLVVHERRYRFTLVNATGALFSYNISAAKLGALESFWSTTTTLSQLWESIRVREICLYGTPPQNGSTVDVAINYGGPNLGAAGPNVSRTATSMGMSVPAFVAMKPPKDSQASQWQSCQTNIGNVTLFTLTVFANGTSNQIFICDIWLDATKSTDSRKTNNTTTITGPASANEAYFLALDNNAGANLSTSNNWVPSAGAITIV